MAAKSKAAKKAAKAISATIQLPGSIIPKLPPIPSHGMKIVHNWKAQRRYGHFQGNKILPGFHPKQDQLLTVSLF